MKNNEDIVIKYNKIISTVYYSESLNTTNKIKVDILLLFYFFLETSKMCYDSCRKSLTHRSSLSIIRITTEYCVYSDYLCSIINTSLCDVLKKIMSKHWVTLTRQEKKVIETIIACKQPKIENIESHINTIFIAFSRNITYY